MDCEQIAGDELVEKYLQGQLEPGLESDFQGHVQECPECLALLETCEDIRDDLAPRAAAIEQKSEKPFWSMGGLIVPRRTAALAGLACLVVVAVAVGVRTGWIPGRGGAAPDNSEGGPVQTTTGGPGQCVSPRRCATP